MTEENYEDHECACGQIIEVCADTERKVARSMAILVETSDLEEHVADWLKFLAEWLGGIGYEQLVNSYEPILKMRENKQKNNPPRELTSNDYRARVDTALDFAWRAMCNLKSPKNNDALYYFDQMARALTRDEYEGVVKELSGWKVVEHPSWYRKPRD